MSQNIPHIRPENVDSLPNLSAEMKIKYKNALTSLWQAYETASTPQAKQEAQNKIRAASSSIMGALQKATAPRNSNAGQQRPAGAQQPGQAQVPQSGNSNQPAQASNQFNHPTAQAGQPGQQPNQNNPQQTAQQLAVQQQQQQDEQKIKAEVLGVQLHQPPQAPAGAFQAYVQNWRNQGMKILRQRQSLANQAKIVNQKINQFKQGGREVPAEWLQKFQSCKSEYEKLTAAWENMKSANAANAAARSQANNTASADAQRPTTQQGAQQQQQQQSSQQPDAKPVAMDQQPLPSPAQPAAGGYQGQNAPGTPAQNVQQQPQQQSQQVNAAPNLQQQAQRPVSQQQQSFGAGNMQQQNNMQQQGNQPQRPQINAQQAAQQMRSQSQMHQTPNSAAPHSASQQHQQPQALTHQAAISQAADQYSRQQQAQAHAQSGQHPNGPQQMPNGHPYGSVPATQHNTPTSAHPYPQNMQAAAPSANGKFPIPKTLSMDPRTQTPVLGPPSRPTLANQGMMNQPNIQRAPPYVLEGEGDHVLSKRKLDELVRQVTGAAPDATGNGESSSVLDPDVEESVLQVADDFVDNVIAAACRLAKLRPNQTLDIRDVQLVLERNYGIRIPGYSLDEVRTVRKFQPAPGWQSKMQAIQAGKVMGNRDL